jgi:hypothetical protein
MKNYWKEAVTLTTIAFMMVLAATARISRPSDSAPRPPGLQPEETELRRETRRVATESLHLRLDEKAEAVHAANFAGLRSENITFTRRLDSRTFLAYDRRFSRTNEFGVNLEPDEKLLGAAHLVLEALQIPAMEISTAHVLQEKTQLGERDGGGKIRLEKIEFGKKYALVTRQVGGIPVFSSRAMIGWTKQGDIGFLEVHWPQIPDSVLEKATRYRESIEKGWHAPERSGLRAESVTAGIWHSPAAGTAMDIYPVIRVIYAPEDHRLGKKPVAYLDPEGKEVTPPRTFLAPPRDEAKRERATPQR